MEKDSIRASGSNTLVEVWIDGKLRAISVSQEAIGAFLGFDRMEGMSEDDRCDFVRRHLGLVITAAKSSLRETDASAESVLIEGAQLRRLGGTQVEDRRKADRRKGNRRKNDSPKGGLPDRRRSDRRIAKRRTRPRDSNEV